ncbi:MAG: hypothetical protein HQK85_04125 [Nitrospinae bacterium]|nr:hypothetical protein [Nitrospinota bacterium]
MNISSEFKIDHPGGGTTIGKKVMTANGGYWSVTVYPLRKEPRTIPLTEYELVKFLRSAGMSEEFVKRVIGKKRMM